MAAGNQNFNDRLQIWKQALEMCEADRESFKTEIGKTAQTIKVMAKPVKFTATLPDFELTKDLVKYSADISAMEMGSATKSEINTNKANLAGFEADVEKISKMAARN